MPLTQYYPEFSAAEIEETIAPLARYDDELTAIFMADGPGLDAPRDTAHPDVREWLAEPERYPFQHIIKSIAAQVAEHDPLGDHADLFDDPRRALIQLLEQIEARLREVCTRPLVAAINHARENGLLAGSTPAERYAYFVAESRRTSFQQMSGLNFGVLTSVTRLLINNQVASVRELCARLAADRKHIAETFGIDPDDRLVLLGAADGDVHHHGRSVSVLTFRSGKRLVYKPRDVSGELAYQTVAHEVNARIGTRLPAARVLRRSGYGYVEYIDAEDVSDMAPEFMRASGELAAVLYLLNARDMHVENILPTRRGPVPIDLETIMHPRRVHAGPTPEAPDNAYDTIAESVYGIGILPLVMAGKDADAGHVDVGFLGGQGQGVSPFKSIQFERPFTDEISLVLRAQEQQQRSTVVGTLTEDEARALGEEMAAGFTRVYRAVLRDPGPWKALLRDIAAGLRIRYVHNPTTQYAQTLRMTAGAHPMDDPAVYIALLKRIAIASKPSAHELVASEMRQLAERDVPYFTVAATSVVLHDGDGSPINAKLSRTPLQTALAKIDRLSEFDLARQLTLIHSAFASRFPDNHLAAAVPSVPAERDRPRTGRTDLAELATRLADHLVATSLPDRFAHLPRTWIGPVASANSDRPWPPGVLAYDLYTGRTGPALALAAAARVLDRPAHMRLAVQIFSAMADILASRRYEYRSIQQAGWAGYTGMAGILLALADAGRLLERAEWVRAAQEAVPLVIRQIDALPSHALPLDVINGLAGVVPCLIGIGGPHAAAEINPMTDRITTALAETAHPPVLDQSGFAHGVSGLIHALALAHPRLPEGRRHQAEEALARLVDRLHHFYDPAENSWFSNVATPWSFATGWCHGSAGIALALTACHAILQDPEVLRLRDIAVANTLRYFGRNLTWCHGDLGNHGILTGIARREDDGRLLRDIAEIEHRWLHADTFERKLADHRSRYAHTSSLMVGTSGVLLHLIERLDPDLRLSPVDLASGGAHAA